jgi:Flp pilus assembly protein TadD
MTIRFWPIIFPLRDDAINDCMEAGRIKMSHPKYSRPARWEVLFLQGALIFLACLWIYTPVYHGEWLWDDDYLITANPAMRSVDGLWRLWFAPSTADFLPLTLSFLWIQWQFFGMDPNGYHIVSILLHALGACFLWMVLVRTKIRGAWLASLLFAIHPLCVESVSWVAEQKNTFSLPFFLLAAFFYVTFDQRESRKYYFWALLAFLAAMLSKSSVVMFPFLILLYAWWQRGAISRRDILRSAPFFLISLALGMVTLLFQLHRAIGNEPIPLGGLDSRLAIAGMGAVFYVTKIFWPFDLLPIYPQWDANPPQPVQFAPWILLIGAGVVFWVNRKSWGRHAMMALGFYFITILPVLGFVAMSYMRVGWVSDHFVYIPMIGIIVLIASASVHAATKLRSLARKAAWLSAGAYAGVLVIQSHSYAGIWANEDLLWLHTLKHNESCWQAHNRYGSREFNRGNHAAALPHFERATALRPDLAETQNNLGSGLLAAKDTKAAVRRFREALRLSPDIIAIQANLGRALMLDGQNDEAIMVYADLVKKMPTQAGFRCNLGITLFNAARIDEAITSFKQALEIDPDLNDAKECLRVAIEAKKNRE